MWKNFYLLVVISLWLMLMGYVASCLLAYVAGCPLFVFPLIVAIVSMAILGAMIVCKLQRMLNVKSIMFIIFISLLLSSFGNTIYLSVKFGSKTYYRAVIQSKKMYLYDKYGFKIVDHPGVVLYYNNFLYMFDSYPYASSEWSKVYAINYDGNCIEEGNFIEVEKHYQDISNRNYRTIGILRQPYTNEKFMGVKQSYHTVKIVPTPYDSISFAGKDKQNNFYFNCSKEDFSDIVKINKDGSVETILKNHKFHDDWTICTDQNGYIHLFIVKAGNSCFFCNLNGNTIMTHQHYTKNIQKLGYGEAGKVYYYCQIYDKKKDLRDEQINKCREGGEKYEVIWIDDESNSGLIIDDIDNIINTTNSGGYLRYVYYRKYGINMSYDMLYKISNLSECKNVKEH